MIRPSAFFADEQLLEKAPAEDDGTFYLAEVVHRLVAEEHSVKVYRDWRKMTQAELAATCDASVGYVSQLERSTRQLSRKAQVTFAHSIGVYYEELDPPLPDI